MICRYVSNTGRACPVMTPHAHCPQCTLSLSAGAAVCPHHHLRDADDWAQRNRAICDWFHRGITPPASLPLVFAGFEDAR